MEEKFEIKGFIRAYATPFSEPSGIIISTDKGDISIPVNDSSCYPLNEKVELSVNIKSVENRE